MVNGQLLFLALCIYVYINYNKSSDLEKGNVIVLYHMRIYTIRVWYDFADYTRMVRLYAYGTIWPYHTRMVRFRIPYVYRIVNA